MTDHVHIDDIDPVEVRGEAGYGLFEGKECDSHSEEVVRKEAKFLLVRSSGLELLRLGGGSGRRSDQGLQSSSGSGRSTSRSPQTDVILAPFRGRKGARSDPVMTF